MNRMEFSVTVVTVVYNNAAHIPGTVESVLSQVGCKVEYIVIDGGSTDGTLAILKEYGNRISVLVSEKDTGIYNAMNKGIALASGDYINFMNCGDVFVNNEVLSELEKFFVCSNYDVIYGSILVRKDSKEYMLKPAPDTIKVMHRMPFCHQSAFVKRAILQQQPFDERYKMSADFKFFKQCYIANYQFVKAPIPVCIYDRTGISNSNRAAGLKENIAIINEIDRVPYRWVYKCRLYFVLLLLALRRKD